MRSLLFFILFALIHSPSTAQRIGVLPFEDASGVGAEFGAQVAKFVRSEFLKDKRFLPKFIDYTPTEDEPTTIDVEKAIELGKKNGVDWVVIGTILEADASSSSSGLGGVRILGQSVGSNVRTVSATITLQGDLISVKEATLIESFREEGSSTEASLGADVYTRWGNINADAQEGNNTPNAKALREAVERLVEEMVDKLE